MATGSMQAAVLEAFGVLFRVATMARPAPGPGASRLDHARATCLAEMGGITPRLDPRRFALGTACDAYRAIQAHDAGGKLVVDIGGAAPGLHAVHQACRAPMPA